MIKATLPGPPPHRLLGRRGNTAAYAADPVRYTARLHHDYGPMSGLIQGDNSQIFAFGSEHNRTIMTSGDIFHTVLEYSVPEGIRRARRGIGLLNMNGPQHREARRLATPSFRPQTIILHSELIADLAASEVDSWRPGEPFDLAEAMRRLTLRIACRSFFGVDIADSASTVGAMVQNMLALRYFAPSIRYFPFNIPGAPYRRLLNVIRRLDDELSQIVEARRAIGGKQDLLNSLITTRDAHGRGLNDDQLIGHLTTLLVAGYETASSTLTWSSILLSQHQEELGHVLESVPERLAGVPVVTGSASENQVLDRVLKETLRLLPPGPNTSRIAVAPTEIDGYEIRAGCQVVTSKFTTHRDHSVFREPLRFVPTRWATAKPSRYQYLPYGAGPHACIGAAFADLEMKIVLATIFGRFRLEPVPGARVSRQVGLMMAPRGEIQVVAVDRGRAANPVSRIDGDIHEMVNIDGSERWRLGW